MPQAEAGGASEPRNGTRPDGKARYSGRDVRCQPWQYSQR